MGRLRHRHPDVGVAGDLSGAAARSLEDWGKLIGDVPSATAILDRFLYSAEVIAITGRSYRLRNRGTKDQPAADAAACEHEKK